MFHTYHHVHIAAVRASVPRQEICLEDELEYYGGSPKKLDRIRRLSGFDKRRVCPDGVTASDLCAFAAEDLLRAFPAALQDIDALLFVSQTPDWDLPATACALQHRLGLSKHCAALDIGQGCSGYVYGLWLAASLIEAGTAKQVLLLVGEARPQGYNPRNRIIAPVFGDGGSATLLTRTEHGQPMSFELGTDGSGHEAIIIPAGRSRIPYLEDFELNRELFEDIPNAANTPWRLNEHYMDGGAIFRFTLDVVPDLIATTLKKAGLTGKDVNGLILHQANRQIMEAVAEKAQFPLEKTPTASFSKFGNLACASIPAALCDTYGGTTSPGRLLLCGYGVGLSWASCLCNIESWDCAPVLEFTPPAGHPTRKDHIRHWREKMTGKKSENGGHQ